MYIVWNQNKSEVEIFEQKRENDNKTTSPIKNWNKSLERLSWFDLVIASLNIEIGIEIGNEIQSGKDKHCVC